MLKNKCQNFWLLILTPLASSEFWLLDLATRPVVKPQSQVHPKAFATHSQLTCDLQKFSRLISWLASRKTPKNSFLKCFSWETCFKPLPSSLKPAFQYFYIKTQSIWMVFHSINISKIILNYFLWLWPLDYVLESFCALGWDFHHKGWEKLFFIKFLYGIGFFCWFALDFGPLWQKEHVLRVDFMMFMHCFTLLFIVCMLGVW